MRLALFSAAFFTIVPILSGPAFAEEMVVERHASLRDRLDAYADAVEQPRFGASKTDKLRIWHRDYMFGVISASLISQGSVRTCKTTSRYLDAGETIQRGTCTLRISTTDLTELLQIPSALARFDGNSLECAGVMDGGIEYVEGLVGESRFVLSYLNPEHCSDELAVLLKRTDRLLFKASQ